MKTILAILLTGFACSILASVPASILASTLSIEKNDFAYGYELITEGDNAIYSLYLNETIYKGMTQANRSDLRIFNRRNEIVPHLIRSSEKKTSHNISPIQLPYFPLYKNKSSDSLDSLSRSIRINTNAQGTIIDLKYADRKNRAPILAGYIIDLSHIANTPALPQPDKITVHWQSDNSSFMQTIRLEGSNDLSRWHTLIAATTLSHMQWNEHTLIQRDIHLPASLPRYLRLSWRDQSTEALTVTSLVAHFPEKIISTQSRHWSSLRPVRVDNNTKSYLYNSQAVLPIEQLNIQLSDNNTLLKVRIESAATENGPWSNHYQGLVYKLQRSKNKLRNPDIKILRTTHPYWRIKIINHEGPLPATPILQLGWQAEELLFVANGEAPFLLAYGSSKKNIKLPDNALRTLLKLNPTAAKPAKLGKTVMLGGELKRKPAAKPRDWKNYILWAVLFIGVGLLGLMVLRLYKQMSQTD